MEVNNPHDAFFIENFSNKEIASSFIRGTFPVNIVNNLDLTTLQIDNNTYSDEELKKYFSDIVYNCKYKELDIKISLLFEHKSFIPDYPFKQILKYMIKIWDYAEKQKENIIPVIPIIFYHGEKSWEYKKVYEYFPKMDDLLKDFIPDFDYILTDMTHYTDNRIQDIFDNELLKISLLIMKNIFNEDELKRNLEKFLTIGQIYFNSESNLKALESLLRYLWNCVENVSVDDIVKTLTKISETGGNTAITIAMKLKNEGKIEGKIENAKKMLVKGYLIEDIADITGLSVEQIEKLKS